MLIVILWLAIGFLNVLQALSRNIISLEKREYKSLTRAGLIERHDRQLEVAAVEVAFYWLLWPLQLLFRMFILGMSAVEAVACKFK